MSLSIHVCSTCKIVHKVKKKMICNFNCGLIIKIILCFCDCIVAEFVLFLCNILQYEELQWNFDYDITTFFFFAYIKINLCFYDCYYIYQALGFLNVWVISHTICQTIKRNLDSFLGVWATWFDKQENYIGTWMICRYSMAQKCYRKRYQSVIFRMRI